MNRKPTIFLTNPRQWIVDLNSSATLMIGIVQLTCCLTMHNLRILIYRVGGARYY